MFGIGASLTVASWTDAERITADFSAGSFAIEASVNNQWSSASEMTFSSAGMFPGTVTAAPVFVRTTPDSTTAGSLRLAGNGVSGGASSVANQLLYRVTASTITPAQVQSFTCPNTGTPSGTFVLGSAAEWVVLAENQSANGSQRVNAAAGNVVAYCFQIRLSQSAPSSVQGLSTTHTWVWNAESLSEAGTP